MERGRERRVISHYQKKKTKFIVDSSLPVTPGALYIKAKGTIFTVVSYISPTTNYTALIGLYAQSRYADTPCRGHLSQSLNMATYTITANHYT